ncbi:hypothetical protein SF12_19700 [Streptomyces sp. MBRL 601]|nr:hypothetical protein SF12_19700 [Streptomyces sp. MBRL 601]
MGQGTPVPRRPAVAALRPVRRAVVQAAAAAAESETGAGHRSRARQAPGVQQARGEACEGPACGGVGGQHGTGRLHQGRGGVAVQQARGDLDAQALGQRQQVTGDLRVQGGYDELVQRVRVPAGRPRETQRRSVLGPLEAVEVEHDPVPDGGREDRGPEAGGVTELGDGDATRGSSVRWRRATASARSVKPAA